MRPIGLHLALLSALAIIATAQEGTDFSGRWVLVSSVVPDPNAAGSLNVRQPMTRTSNLGAPMPPAFVQLIVERQFTDRTTTETHSIGVRGGIVGGTAGGTSIRSDFSVRWEGQRLMIERGSHADPAGDARPYWEHTEEWELDSAGMLVVTVTDRASDTEPKSNTFVYRRN